MMPIPAELPDFDPRSTLSSIDVSFGLTDTQLRERLTMMGESTEHLDEHRRLTAQTLLQVESSNPRFAQFSEPERYTISQVTTGLAHLLNAVLYSTDNFSKLPPKTPTRGDLFGGILTSGMVQINALTVAELLGRKYEYPTTESLESAVILTPEQVATHFMYEGHRYQVTFGLNPDIHRLEAEDVNNLRAGMTQLAIMFAVDAEQPSKVRLSGMRKKRERLELLIVQQMMIDQTIVRPLAQVITHIARK